MTTTARRFTASLLGLLVSIGASSGASAAAPPPAMPSPETVIGRTPPRLSYVDGEVSFWRPGAPAWAPARVNTALAPGDETYTGNRGNLELQVGARAFVRAWGDTQLRLVSQEPDFLQLEIPAGHVSLDLRGVEPGHAVEIDTPAAAFTIEVPGYYRVDVTPQRTAFITRRSGRATMTPAGGAAVAIAASEAVVLDAAATPAVQSFVAPPLDVWDTWNYARTDELIDSMSARYVPAGVYGVGDLDHYGAWRVVPTYGALWVPRAVATGWAPWGSPRFVGRPWWAGWGGPHVVNNVVVERTTVVNVQHIAVYNNAAVRNAVVAVREDAFGRRAVHEARVTVAAPAPRIVPAPQPASTPTAPRPPRAPFGNSPVERQRSTDPPRFETPRQDTRTETLRPDARAQTPRQDVRADTRRPEPRAETPRPELRPDVARDAGRRREAMPSPRALPGEPANRVSPWGGESGGPRPSAPAPGPTATPAPPDRTPTAPAPAIDRRDARPIPPRQPAEHPERDERPARGR